MAHEADLLPNMALVPSALHDGFRAAAQRSRWTDIHTAEGNAPLRRERRTAVQSASMSEWDFR